MNKKNKLFQWSWKLGVLSGLFPLVVGSWLYFNFLQCIVQPFPDYWLGWIGIPSSHNIASAQTEVIGAHVHSLVQVMTVNLMNTGFMICCISFFWYRTQASRSSFFVFLICLLWVGGNDCIALVYTYLNIENAMFPVPIFPIILGLVSLALGVPKIFFSSKAEEINEI